MSHTRSRAPFIGSPLPLPAIGGRGRHRTLEWPGDDQLPAPGAPRLACGSPAKHRARAGSCGADAETAELRALRRPGYCVCIRGCSGRRAGDRRCFQISQLRALQSPANSWLGHVTAGPPSASRSSGPQDQTMFDCQGLRTRPTREGREGEGNRSPKSSREGGTQSESGSLLSRFLFLGCSSLKEKKWSFKEPGPASSWQRFTGAGVWSFVWAFGA